MPNNNVIMETDHFPEDVKLTPKHLLAENLDWSSLIFWMDRLDEIREEYAVIKENNRYFIYLARKVGEFEKNSPS